jgi:hypothetical protein
MRRAGLEIRANGFADIDASLLLEFHYERGGERLGNRRDGKLCARGVAQLSGLIREAIALDEQRLAVAREQDGAAERAIVRARLKIGVGALRDLIARRGRAGAHAKAGAQEKG